MTALRKAAARIGRIIQIRRQQLFELNDPAAIVAVVPGMDVKIVCVSEENVDAVTGFRDRGIAAMFRRFLGDGQLGVYATAADSVVGHAWALTCPRRGFRANGYLALREGEACIHFCQVQERCRGKGIYPAMLAALCSRLFRGAAARRVLIDAAVDNAASLRGICKAGFRPTERRLYIQLARRLVFERKLADADASAPRGNPGGSA